jgi:hypothetical protein
VVAPVGVLGTDVGLWLFTDGNDGPLVLAELGAARSGR